MCGPPADRIGRMVEIFPRGGRKDSECTGEPMRTGDEGEDVELAVLARTPVPPWVLLSHIPPSPPPACSPPAIRLLASFSFPNEPSTPSLPPRPVRFVPLHWEMGEDTAKGFAAWVGKRSAWGGNDEVVGHTSSVEGKETAALGRSNPAPVDRPDCEGSGSAERSEAGRFVFAVGSCRTRCRHCSLASMSMTPPFFPPPAPSVAFDDEGERVNARFPASFIGPSSNTGEGVVVATQEDRVDVVAVLPPLTTEDSIRVG